jgi:hypothetical protein
MEISCKRRFAMADEESGINRRNFLKSAGVVVTGSTLGAGLTLAANPAAAAPPVAPDAPQLNATGYLANPVSIKLKVNGKENQVQIEPHWTLQRTLQFKLGLTGAKQMCDRGVCGSCTVIMDGRAVLSCTTLAVECEGKEIETVEGIAANKKWDPLIKSYCIRQGAAGQKSESYRKRLQAGACRQHLLLRHLPKASYRHHRSGAGYERRRITWPILQEPMEPEKNSRL